MNEEKYIKGFNNGYVLAEHKPELLQSVTVNMPALNDYVAGLLEGKEQSEIERMQREINRLSEQRNNSSNRGNGLEIF